MPAERATTGSEGHTATRDLIDDRTARDFYDARYNDGYMESWPARKLARVAAVIRELGLPATGTALDFGCGAGVFTNLLKEVLPRWTIVGSDFSAVALQSARQRFPACRFVEPDACATEGPFDLLFSHHVIEHISDLPDAVSRMAAMISPAGRMFHILPCGNPGSLEHEICAARRDGIDRTLGGRFFFEDEGHLRRLTTTELAAAFAGHGFTLGRQFYANQQIGAEEWLTGRSREWLKMVTDPDAAATDDARDRLTKHRGRLLALNLLRRPPSLLRRGAEWRLQKEHRTLKDWAILVAGNPLTIVSPLVDRMMERAAEREWAQRRTDTAGSEMFLEFRRSGARAE